MQWNSASGPSPQNQPYYCYWDIRSTPDFILTILNLTLSLVILSQIVIAYTRSKKLLQHDSSFKIYYFLFAWYLSYNVEYLFGAIVYKGTFEGIDGEFQRDTVVGYSVVFQVMDFWPAFLLVGCLYFVSYYLLKRIHSTCENNGHHPSKAQLNFYSGLKKYQIFRILYFAPTIALLFFDHTDVQSITICSTIEMAFYLLDSLLCNIALLISLRTFRKKNALLNLSSQQEKMKLKRDSILLQVAGICRFVMGLSFIFISTLIDQDDQASCPYQNQLRTWFYLLGGQIIMHFMPVLVILSIFRISSHEMEIMQRDSADLLQTRLQDD